VEQWFYERFPGFLQIHFSKVGFHEEQQPKKQFPTKFIYSQDDCVPKQPFKLK